MTTRLSDLPRGARARVLSLDGGVAASQRLLEMGLTAGAAVEVLRFAPLGDPVEIRVRGYALSLRRQEAKGVVVEVVAP
jgi:ferrous iron transport protein A